MSNNKTMNSNIQILRFIAMLLIVCFHGRTMLGFKELADQSIWLFAGMRAVTSWGLVGVWIFVAISGFYLVGKPFHIRRVFSILFQVLIYITALYTTFFFVEANNGSTPDIASKKIYESFIDSVFAPLWAGGYWYITSYLLTLFFLPVINLLFKKCSLATIKKI